MRWVVLLGLIIKRITIFLRIANIAKSTTIDSIANRLISTIIARARELNLNFAIFTNSFTSFIYASTLERIVILATVFFWDYERVSEIWIILLPSYFIYLFIYCTNWRWGI